MPNDPCVKCGLRPNAWFTDEGYICDECKSDLDRRKREEAHSDLIESMARALMVAHHDDWDMETVREAAHICAAVVYPEEESTRA